MTYACEGSRNPALTRRNWLSTTLAAGAAMPIVKTSADEQAAPVVARKPTSVIYIFLSGGLGQQDSFDMKPAASAEVRGQFSPIATATPGLQVCEHMPGLAARSDRWAVCRSLSHKYNEHSQGHMVMLSGRSQLPTGFNLNMPKPTDHPSIASLLGALLPERNGLPSSVVLPEKLVHRTGRVIPGQFGGVMGKQRDPWFLAASRFNARTYGAWPEYEFHHQRGAEVTKDRQYNTPALSLPIGFEDARMQSRSQLLSALEEQADSNDRGAFERYRERAIAMIGDGKLSELFDIHKAPADALNRYGRNSFGWSLLLARRLASAGVGFVQVNLGNNETWDTHGNAFHNLKNFLFPPMDRAVSALLDDLSETGELDNTLIVMAGEFGRTPKVFQLNSQFRGPGRDHWGAVQSVMLAGCGFEGGKIIGSSDKHGGQPANDRKSVENLAATMYQTLGFDPHANWYDLQNRPMPLFNGDPLSAS